MKRGTKYFFFLSKVVLSLQRQILKSLKRMPRHCFEDILPISLTLFLGRSPSGGPRSPAISPRLPAPLLGFPLQAPKDRFETAVAHPVAYFIVV